MNASGTKARSFLGTMPQLLPQTLADCRFFVNVNNMILNAKYGGCSPSTLHIWINLILDRSVRDISLLHR